MIVKFCYSTRYENDKWHVDSDSRSISAEQIQYVVFELNQGSWRKKSTQDVPSKFNSQCAQIPFSYKN